MKRWMCIVVLLLVLMAIPLAVHAAPLLDNGTVTPAPTAEPTATPDPDGSSGTTDDLSKALGTLAVYAAIIAALAAGTEVITDLLRPFFGLERQPQAMETFEQMKEWLPATLKEMGVDPQAQAQLQGHLNELDKAAKTIQKQISGENIAETVQKWALGAIKSGSAQLDIKLKELETTLAANLKLNPNDIQKVKTEVETGAKAIFATLESGEKWLQELRDFLDPQGSLGLSLTPAQIDSAVGQALELMNRVVDENKLQLELKQLLTGLGVQANIIDQAVEEVSKILKLLKGASGAQGVLKLASSLDSFDTLLREVQSQRAEGASYLRRLWRALRDWKGFGLMRLLPDKEPWKEIRKRSLLGVLLYYPEQAWNWLRDNLFSSAEGKESLSTLLTPENAAKAIQALDRQHYLTEARRQRLLRFTTVFIGIALAVVLRIDSLELLKPLFKEGLLPELFADGKFKTLEQILEGLLGVQWAVETWTGLGKWLFAWIAAATPGMLLSGLAASAGSSFWHDQLDRLRAAKKVTEEVKTVVGQMQS